MDLRSHHPIWTLGAAPPANPSLTQDVRCDTAIIGAGVAGAMIAHTLTAAGVECIVLDRREPARGATAASTALLLYDLDLSLVELSKAIGEESAAACYRLGLASIDTIERLASAFPDRCGFSRRHSLYLASTPHDARALKGEQDCRLRNGFNVRLLSRHDIDARYSFSSPAALDSPDGAQVDGFRLTHALLEAAKTTGLRVYARTNVLTPAHPARGESYVLTTDGGHTISAHRVVIASGYEAAAWLKHLHPPARLVSTYAVATAPITHFYGWPKQPLIWETSRPYLYLRTTPDRRAIIGGGDESITNPDERDALIPRKASELMARFQTMFPEIQTQTETAWAGFFMETPDSLPYIGEHANHPGLYLALCYSGNGTTFAAIAADIIRAQILGEPTPHAQLFRIDR